MLRWLQKDTYHISFCDTIKKLLYFTICTHFDTTSLPTCSVKKILMSHSNYIIVFSDFDSDELEQLAGSGDDESEDINDDSEIDPENSADDDIDTDDDDDGDEDDVEDSTDDIDNDESGNGDESDDLDGKEDIVKDFSLSSDEED